MRHDQKRQLTGSRVHPQTTARRVAEAATDALRRDLCAAHRDLDAVRDSLELERSRAAAAASELAALRESFSAAATAVRGLLTTAAANVDERLRAAF